MHLRNFRPIFQASIKIFTRYARVNVQHFQSVDSTNFGALRKSVQGRQSPSDEQLFHLRVISVRPVTSIVVLVLTNYQYMNLHQSSIAISVILVIVRVIPVSCSRVVFPEKYFPQNPYELGVRGNVGAGPLAHLLLRQDDLAPLGIRLVKPVVVT